MGNNTMWGNSKDSIEVELKPKETQEIILVDQEISLESPEISLETHKK